MKSRRQRWGVSPGEAVTGMLRVRPVLSPQPLPPTTNPGSLEGRGSPPPSGPPRPPSPVLASAGGPADGVYDSACRRRAAACWGPEPLASAPQLPRGAPFGTRPPRGTEPALPRASEWGSSLEACAPRTDQALLVGAQCAWSLGAEHRGPRGTVTAIEATPTEKPRN